MQNTEQTIPNPGKVSAWVSAFRPRTLPLALASIAMGGIMAAVYGAYNGWIVFLCALTTIFLQILSNLANDYGDSKHGADSHHREGPKRAVQAGHISAAQMKTGMIIFVILSLVSGISLLWLAFGFRGMYLFLFFLVLGLASIWAAINYTAGSKPYGYAGLGDISVFIFFGLVGVIGTFFLQTQTFSWMVVLPAMACGFFSTAVLNVNNIRDINSDKIAGKISIPVRLGPEKARVYHWFLLMAGFLCAVAYCLLNFVDIRQFLFVLVLPLLVFNGYKVWKLRSASQLDPFLKQMALTTMLFVLLFGIGQLWAGN